MKPGTEGFMPQGSGGDFDRKRFDIIHKTPLRFYCLTTDELISYESTVMGPHNTPLHRICSIEDAFRDRFDEVNKAIY